jgi:hypothetical protein
LIDQFLAPIKEPAAVQEVSVSDTPKTIEDIRNRTTDYVEPSAMTKLGKIPLGYLQSVEGGLQNSVDTMRSGAVDFFGGKAPIGGIAKMGLGAISYPMAPVTGAIHQFVEKPVTELTGSPDIGQRAGLVVGSGLPIIPAAKAISNRMPTNAALNAITSSVSAAELAEGLQRLKSNPRLSVMDVFPSVRQMGQKLITTEGTHQNKFEKFVNERIGSRKEAIEDIYHETTGKPPNVLLKLNQLASDIKDVGKEINPILDSANPVDMSGVIRNIDAKLKPGITSIISTGEPLPLGDIEKPLANLRKFLTDDKSVRTDANSLHQFQSALRTKAEDLAKSTNGQDRQLAYALRNVRNDIVNAIDAAAPGYKGKLAKYRDANDVNNAFDKGYGVTKNRAGEWDDRPEFWEQWIKGASKQELEASREGARVAFNDALNGTRFAGRKGMEIPETPFNREKLEMLFGKKEVNEMASRLRDERDIADVNQKLIGNSQTAMRTKADSKVDLPERKESGLTTGLAGAVEAAGMLSTGYPGASAAVLVPKAAGWMKHKFVDLPLAMKKNDKLTDLLTATGEDRDALIQLLEASLPRAKLSIGQKARLAIGP